MNKKQLRDQLLKTRQELPEAYVREQSQRIVETFKKQVPIPQDSVVHLFRSVTKFREVQTSFFFDWFSQERKDIRCVIPRVVQGNNDLSHHLFKTGDALVESRWGIEEPLDSAPQVAANEIDIVIVPLLGFDRKGYRIGYGGGFYDRFLAQTREDSLKIGVALNQSFQSELLPVDEFDIALTMMVTPSQILRFS